MPKKLVRDCLVLENTFLGTNIYKMVFAAPEICAFAEPGQFIQLKTGLLDSPLLRRPLSIADVEGEKLTIVYRVVGAGTKLLAKCQAGDFLSVLGPLGRGFEFKETKRALLVGGGIGIAPLIYLARKLKDTYPSLLLAARCRAEIVLWQTLFQDFCGQSIYATTDDGSIGTQGTAMALLPKLLAENNYAQLYSCGPEAMLKAIASFAKEEKVPCQISLESHMACGIGVCLACSCNSQNKERFKICQNGPVFEAGEVQGF